jgi:pilus assembly protein CpaC
MQRKRGKLVFLVLYSLSIFLCIEPILAETIGEETVKLIAGETKIIPVRSPTRVVIGNPQVADVADVTNSEITISAKSAGKTTLVYWDIFGEQSINIKVMQEDMGEIKQRIDNLLSKLNLPQVYTQANEDESMVMLLGRVKNSQDRERISTALGKLKEKVIDVIEVKEEEAVVNIDVEVLELDKDAINTLGFTMPGSINLVEKASSGISSVGSKVSTLFKVLNLQRATRSDSADTADPFIFKLDALVQEGKARILSRPRLSCQSGKEAELLVGGEKPIFTTSVASNVGTSTSVDYKEFGIKLKIKPTVAEGGRIKLALDVEVSEVGTAEFIGSTTQRTAQAYPLTKRNASTELYLDDGQTMAIGGLMKHKNEEDLRKTAILGDIPILGAFFRKRTSRVGGGAGERGNIELFIALTPKIIRDNKEAEKPKIEASQAAQRAPLSNSDADIPAYIRNYAQIIQKRILENLSYPALAKEAGFQGTVKLSLLLSHSGQLLDAVIKSSSGFNILDKNTLSVVKAIAVYPPFPASIDKKELWIDIPVVYSLD